MVSKAIESAQRQVESMHFSARKNLLEYDDVMNAQRTAVYAERAAVLGGKDMGVRVPSVIADAACAVVEKNCPKTRGSWNVRAVEAWAASMTGRKDFSVEEIDHGGEPAKVADALISYLQHAYDQKESQIGAALMTGLAQNVMMRAIDMRWMTHLREMERLAPAAFVGEFVAERVRTAKSEVLVLELSPKGPLVGKKYFL